MSRGSRLSHGRRLAPLAGAAAVAVAAGLAVAAPSGAAMAAAVSAPASLVNPFIGTGNGGNTFPGPDMPFGMLQWGPDTANPRQNGGGYSYAASQILGFSLNRLSGAGCPVDGDVPILPMVGAIPANPEGATVNFSHSAETAQVGYYGVTTTSPGAASNPVTTQITTGMRSGIARFRFPASAQSDLLLKVADSELKLVTSGGQTSSKYKKVFGTSAQVVGDNEVTGSVTVGHFCNISDDNHSNYTLYFDIKFDQPFTASGTWPGGPAGDPGGVSITFDTTQSRTVTAKAGISYTSAAGAALNLATEIPGWDFDAVRAANVQAWNTMLSRIQVGGGTASEQAQFYTALYHSLLDPHVYSDVNGQYTGVDGKIHTVAPGHAQYADYSGWDIYRDEVQLLSLLDPARAGDIVSSMLTDYGQDGMLPKWELGNAETYEMVGDPADPIIAGAYAFGVRGFDARTALADMVAEAVKPGNIRPGLDYYELRGYLPLDGTYGCCHFYGPVSTALEYETADYGIAAFAKALHDQSTYTEFAARAQNWEDTFNPATGYMQARLADGQWAPGFTPGTSTGMVEGTAAQYTPMVPFNLQAVIAARGGPQAWNSFLDSLLTDISNPGPTGANLSNEPSLVIPWEYDYTGEPWKTQRAVRQAQDQVYADAPAGVPGNEDLGAMSSWYVWSALGMYPPTPGTGTLVLGSPIFPHAVVHLTDGKDLTIDAPDAADGAPYVQSLELDGQDWSKTYLDWNQLRNGANLSFGLGTSPSAWGSGPAAAPPSDATGEAAAIPYLPAGEVNVPPGQSTTVTLAAQNVTGRPVTASASAAPPAGISVSPDPARVTLPGGDQRQATLTVTAAAGAPPGSYSVPITLSADGYAGRVTAELAVRVAR